MSKPLPTISLARTEPKAGSKEWLDRLVHEHSKTSPQQIERRRLRLSALATMIDGCIQKVQTQKKIMIASSRNMLAANEADRAAQRAAMVKAGDLADQLPTFDAETNRILSEIKASMDQQELQYEITIATLTAQLANIEGHCLVVDCVSIRNDVVNKGKTKYGKARFPLADFVQEQGFTLLFIREMIADLYRSSRDEETLTKLEEKLEEEVCVETEADDDIVTDDEAEEIKGDKKKEKS